MIIILIYWAFQPDFLVRKLSYEMLNETTHPAGLNPCLTKTAYRFGRLSKYFLIFGLTGGGVANILLFYLGLHGTTLRAKLFIIAAVIIFCLACLRLLQIYITMPQYRRLVRISLIYPFCAILLFGGAFVIFGRSAFRSFDLMLQFGCFCIPAYIFGLDCMLNRRESTLFLTLDALAVFYIPFAILCLYILGSSNNITGKLETIGDLNYMSVAYILFVPLAFLIIRPVFLRNNQFPLKSTNSEFFPSRILTIVFALLALLYWFVVLSAGTRGVIACVLGLFVFLLLWTAYRKQKVCFLRSVIMFALFIIVFFLFMFVIKSSATSDAVGRMNFFVDNLLHGSFQTSTTRAVSQVEINTIIDEPVSAGKSKSGSNADNIKSTNGTKDSKAVDKKNNSKLDPLKVVMNREQLYKAAWGEFLQSPVWGMGPLGFYIKYGRYVHNIFLEILCDYGIVGGGIFFSVLLILIVRLTKSATRNVNYSIMLAYLLCLNLSLLASNSFYIWPPVWFFLGYTSGMRGIKTA